MEYFPSNRRKLQRDLFVTLGLDDKHQEDFIKKCQESDIHIIVSARDDRLGNEGRTLLHSASKLGCISAVKYLLSVGHDIDPIDSSVSLVTPLQEAISSNKMKLACLLVEAGASLFHVDIRNENSLHYAARVGSRMVLGLFKAAKLSKERIQELLTTSNVKNRFPEDLANSDLTREVLYDFREHGRHIPKTRKTLDTYEAIIQNAKTKDHGFNYNFILSTESNDSDDMSLPKSEVNS